MNLSADMTEIHPWSPFVPMNAKVLIMGTFPPKPSRWSMNFYYPNRQNDFWRIMGLVFYNDPFIFWDEAEKRFNLERIKRFLDDKGIALNDTGHEVRRLRDNASDKFLEIVRPVDLGALLADMPGCNVIATTGEKAAGVIAQLTGTDVPRMGEEKDAIWTDGRRLRIFRMPSTSRAYPLAIARKADYYRSLFDAAGVL